MALESAPAASPLANVAIKTFVQVDVEHGSRLIFRGIFYNLDERFRRGQYQIEPREKRSIRLRQVDGVLVSRPFCRARRALRRRLPQHHDPHRPLTAIRQVSSSVSAAQNAVRQREQKLPFASDAERQTYFESSLELAQSIQRDAPERVTVIDDLSNGRLENLSGAIDRITFVQKDITTPPSEWFDGEPPAFDVIYNLACWPRSRSFTDPKRDVEINVIGMVLARGLAHALRSRRVDHATAPAMRSTMSRVKGSSACSSTAVSVRKFSLET